VDKELDILIPNIYNHNLRNIIPSLYMLLLTYKSDLELIIAKR